MDDREIRTPRLRLRPCREEDVSGLHALWTDPEVRRFLWDGKAISCEQAREVVRKSEDSFRELGLGLWAVFLAAEPGLAGFAGLRPIEGTAEIEVLYGLHPRVWGLGLATEAAAAVLRHAFARGLARRVWARADAPNTASFGVMRRLGMRPASGPGSEAGLVCYEISAAEYAEASLR
jgi:RimJ/RimL family protein N-acetyltransferase